MNKIKAGYFNNDLTLKDDFGTLVVSREETIRDNPNFSSLYYALKNNDSLKFMESLKTDKPIEINSDIRKSIFDSSSEVLITETTSLLNYAMEEPIKEAVKMLLEKKADPNKLTEIQFDFGAFNSLKTQYYEEFSYSPLYKAIINDDMESVKSLLENKADPNIGISNKNYYKFPIRGTEREVVYDYNSYGIVVDYDIKVLKQNHFTPLQEAIEKKSLKLADLLVKYGAKEELLPKKTQEQYRNLKKKHERAENSSKRTRNWDFCGILSLCRPKKNLAPNEIVKLER